MNIAVVESGYVGLVAAACFAELGHRVISVDNDAAKIAALTAGETPIHEDYLPELLNRHRGRSLTFSTAVEEAVRASQIIFIAVGTPASDSGDADLYYVETVSREIAAAIDDYKIIVEKSTVPVFTCEWIRHVLLLSGVPEKRFDVCSNPEFLREGSAVMDFLYPDRIVVGADTARAREVLRSIYSPLVEGSYRQSRGALPQPSGAQTPARLIVTSAKSAELIKHASNAFLAMKISFINSVANVCEAAGADIDEVCAGMGSDSRIGPRFLRAGIGYGGSCFPKDVLAFRSVARGCGCNFPLLDGVVEINDEQRERYLRKVQNALWTLKGKRLAVLGLAFKDETDDIRESPAIAIVAALRREGCEVVVYDPAAMERARALPQLRGVQFADTSYATMADADALLILTEWREFANLDLDRVRRALRSPIVVDGRNLYRPEQMHAAGLIYYSIGRPVTAPVSIAASAARLRRESHPALQSAIPPLAN